MSNHQSSTFYDVYKAFTGSKTGPFNQGSRNDLDTSLRQYPRKKLFTEMLDMTNRGLGMNTGVPLPQDKSDIYKEHAKRVQNGTMSSTEAFGRSTFDWARRGDIPGTVMNGLGTMFSLMYEGMEEHRKRKTGQW